MADCEGDRDRAIALMEAELQLEVRQFALTLSQAEWTVIGIALAMFIFAASATSSQPSIGRWILMGLPVLYIVLIPRSMKKRGERWANDLKAKRAALMAIIEADYLKCADTSEEE